MLSLLFSPPSSISLLFRHFTRTMTETTIINNHVIAEIKLPLSYMIQSTELSTRINPTLSRTQTAQPVSTPTHVLSPHLLPPSIPTSYDPNSTSTPYPIKYLTYAEMQQRRDRDLYLICNEKDTSAIVAKLKESFSSYLTMIRISSHNLLQQLQLPSAQLQKSHLLPLSQI